MSAAFFLGALALLSAVDFFIEGTLFSAIGSVFHHARENFRRLNLAKFIQVLGALGVAAGLVWLLLLWDFDWSYRLLDFLP